MVFAKVNAFIGTMRLDTTVHACFARVLYIDSLVGVTV